MAKGCANKTSSDYYLYTISGFDPCHFFDFSSKTTIKYNLQCRNVDSKRLVIEDGHPEGVRYDYQDVVLANGTNITASSLKPSEPFKYGAVNNETNFKVA